MHLWLGHYAGDDWFLVWSPTRESALMLMRQRFGGEPDPDSLRRVDGEGCLWFCARAGWSAWDGTLGYFRPTGTHGQLPLSLDPDSEAHIVATMGGDPGLPLPRGRERRREEEARERRGGGAKEKEPLVRLVEGARKFRRRCTCIERLLADGDVCDSFTMDEDGQCAECGHAPICHPLRR